MTEAGGHEYLRTHTLSAEHLVLDLGEAEVGLQALATEEQQHRGVTLVREGGLTVVLMFLRSGASLEEHSAPGATTVQVLSGHVELLLEDAQLDAPSGRLVAFDAKVRHGIRAFDDSTLLLTLTAPPSAEAITA